MRVSVDDSGLSRCSILRVLFVFGSLLLCLCDVVRAPVNSLVCQYKVHTMSHEREMAIHNLHILCESARKDCRGGGPFLFIITNA